MIIPDIRFFNLTKRFAVLSDDRIVPIALLLDEDGDETQDEDDAVTIVCGSDNLWFTVPLANFDQVPNQ